MYAQDNKDWGLLIQEWNDEVVMGSFNVTWLHPVGLNQERNLPYD